MNKQLSELDIISVLGFLITLKNLDLNLSQEDFQKTANALDSDINEHLKIQDQKIDYIIELLEEIRNEQATDVQ